MEGETRLAELVEMDGIETSRGESINIVIETITRLASKDDGKEG